jgi:hypothetical protein
MKERLLFDGIALHSADVTPRNVQRASAIKTHLADAGLSFWNRAAMPTGKTAHAIAIKLFDQARIGLSNALVKDLAEGGHARILRRRATECLWQN